MTLAIGLASVFFFNTTFKSRDEIVIDLPKTESSDVFIVFPQERKTFYGNKRFVETWRACRPGHVQGYVSDDGIELCEGNLGCRKSEKNNERVIQKDSKRIISEIKLNNETRYKIYQPKTGGCIDSPSIELGLELENFLMKK